LHRQRRLGDAGEFGGAAEMSGSGKRAEIAKLAERKHEDQNI
jgi:hypothetical protein